MKDPSEVAAAMVIPLASVKKAGRTQALLVFVVTVVMAFIYLDRFVAAIGALPEVWRVEEQWAFFWGPAAIMLAVAPLNLIRPWEYVAASRRARRAVFTARAAAVAGDADLAPRVTEQPDPQQSDDPKPALAAIGPLRRSTGSRATTQLASCIVLLVFGGILAITTIALLFTVPSGTAKSIGLLVLVGLTAGFLGAALLLALAWRRERWVVVHAGDTGLSWTESGVRRRHVDAGWHEVQAFVKVRFRTTTQGTWQELYALDAQRAVLAWYIKSTASDSELEAHTLLSGLIASHTALQLRELTDTIEKLDRSVSEPPTSVSPAAPVDEVQDTVASPAPSGSKASRKVHWGHVAAVAFSLPALLLGAGGWALQQYQPHYYEGLDARIHAEQPLYSDRLNAVDGDWLARQPTKSDARTYTYTNHTYQLIRIPVRMLASARSPADRAARALAGASRGLTQPEHDASASAHREAPAAMQVTGASIVSAACSSRPQAPDWPNRQTSLRFG